MSQAAAQVEQQDRQQRHSTSSLSAPLSTTDTIIVNVAGTRYSVVSIVAEELGMTITNDYSVDCDLFWIDSGVGIERFLEMKHYQYVNHFPGMAEICRKDSLSRNMEKMRKLHKEEYSFVPRTWVLPGEYNSLSTFMRELKRRRRTKTFIIKPHNSAMGNGISLARSIEDINKDQNVVVQEYLEKPFLLDGFKIDLRVYVLVSSYNPLRIFVYKDGLVRLSTQPYVPPTFANLDQHFMHLTNYSVNKHSDKFDNSEEVDQGSKRTLQYFSGWLAQNGYCVAEMWANIHDIIIKTLIVTAPHLIHSYQACRPGSGLDEKCQCFEILGFDILLDEALTPWLLEVNRAPSFGTDSKLDFDIKAGLIKDTFKIINLVPSERKKERAAHKIASRQRLLNQTPSRPLRYDFLAEQESAAYELGRRKKEVRERLEQVRREKNQFEHEQKAMGNYVRVYPSTDWSRSTLYKVLITSASTISLIGKVRHGATRKETPSPLQRLKEHELEDLLSQYEDGERAFIPPSSYSPRPCSSTMYQPLSIKSNNPMDAVYKVMAARVAEEEQTQRTMIALNETKISYPGKGNEVLNQAITEIDSNLNELLPNMAHFWLTVLDTSKRKQLLFPIKETINSIIHCYWRRENIANIRLNQIFLRLFNFLLSRGGQGLWSAFAPKEKTWEQQFKEKSSVLSVIEMVCCRRIVELCQGTVKAAFYFHHLHYPSSSTKQKNKRPPRLQSVSTIPKSPSLPTISKPAPNSHHSKQSPHSHPPHLTTTTAGFSPSTSYTGSTPNPVPPPPSRSVYHFSRGKSKS